MQQVFRRSVVVGFIVTLASAAAQAQTPPLDIVYLGQVGQVSSDGTDPTSWSPQQLPTAADRVVFTGGGYNNRVMDLGANDVTWYSMFFNNNGPSTINGTGTITLAVPYDANGNGDALSEPDYSRGIFTAGGEAFGPLVGTPSVINPNLVTQSYIETNGGHSLTFNGSVTALTVQAYAGTKVTFNGPVTLTATDFPNDDRFFTGNDTLPVITFNNSVALYPRDDFDSSGFSVRNQTTVVFGPAAHLSSNVNPNGWGTFNLYNGSTLRLNGDNRLGTETDVYSRGANSILTNTLDLNGHSDSVEYLGTAGDSTLIVDFGTVAATNSLTLATTTEMNGLYSVTNFKVGTDTLNLGTPGNGFWFGTGDPVAEAARLATITIDNLSYAPFNAATTTPYWTVVDPTTSRAVQFFNYATFNADFDSNMIVDGKDVLIYQRGLGLINQTDKTKGDANGSGKVDFNDLVLIKQQFGTNPGFAAVPEPAAVSLALCGLAGIAARRRDR